MCADPGRLPLVARAGTLLTGRYMYVVMCGMDADYHTVATWRHRRWCGQERKRRPVVTVYDTPAVATRRSHPRCAGPLIVLPCTLEASSRAHEIAHDIVHEIAHAIARHG